MINNACNRSAVSKLTCKEKINYLYTSLSKAKIRADTLNALNNLGDFYSDTKCLKKEIIKTEIYEKLNMYPEAKKGCFSILSIDTLNIWALSELGFMYYDTNAFDSSIYYLQKAINIKSRDNFLVDLDTTLNKYASSPDVPSDEIFYFLGLNYYYQRHLMTSLNYFTYCINDNYRLPDTYFHRGIIYYEMKQNDKSSKDLLKAKSLGNSNAELYINKFFP